MSNNSKIIETDPMQIKIYVDPKPKGSRARAVIRIDENVYDDLVRLNTETGISICDLASEMLRFARDHITIVERTVGYTQGSYGRG